LEEEAMKVTSFTEHLVFAALLIPTFVVLSAAVVSLAPLDPSVVNPAQISALIAEEPVIE
jgi:hypothetical protein